MATRKLWDLNLDPIEAHSMDFFSAFSSSKEEFQEFAAQQLESILEIYGVKRAPQDAFDMLMLIFSGAFYMGFRWNDLKDGNPTMRGFPSI